MLQLFFGTAAFAQQVKFNHVIDANITPLGAFTSIAQDHRGYIWLSAVSGGNAHGGLYRYDGFKTVSFMHDPKDNNSLAICERT